MPKPALPSDLAPTKIRQWHQLLHAAQDGTMEQQLELLREMVAELSQALEKDG